MSRIDVIGGRSGDAVVGGLSRAAVFTIIVQIDPLAVAEKEKAR